MSFYLAEIKQLRKNVVESYKDGDFKKALFLGKYLLEIYTQNGYEEHPGMAEDTHNVAVIFDELGMYDKAVEYYRQAAALKKARFGESCSFADTLNNLAITYNHLGRQEDALKILTQVLEVRENKQEQVDYIYALCNLGNTYETMKEYDHALKYLGQALEKIRTCKTIQMMDVADIHVSMARCFEQKGNYRKAIFCYELALDIIEKKQGVHCLSYMINAISLAFVCEKAEFTGLAVEYFESAMEIRRKLFPEGDLDYVNNLSYLATLSYKDGQFDKALELRKTAMEVVEALFGQEHLLYADILGMIALDYSGKRDFAKALEYGQRALELKERAVPNEEIQITKGYLILGDISVEMRNCKQALTYYEKAIDILDGDIDGKQSVFADVWYKIAKLFDTQGAYEAAAFLYEFTLKISRALSVTNPEEDICLLKSLAEMRQKQEEYMEAVLVSLEMERSAKKLYGNYHPKYALVLKQLGIMYQKSGDLTAAAKCLKEALMIQKEALDEDNPNYIKTLEAFAEVCYDRGDYSRAIELCKERNDVNFEETAQEQREAACTLLAIGNCYLNLKDYEKAKAYLSEAEEKIIQSRLLPNDKFNQLKEIYLASEKGGLPTIKPERRRMRNAERRCLEETVSYLIQFYKRNNPNIKHENIRTTVASFLLGETNQRLGQKEEAIYWYTLAEKGAEPEYYVRACTRLGEAYWAYGEEEKAFQKFINVKEYIAEYGDKDSLEYCRILGYIGDYFYKKGNKETALGFYLLWKHLYKDLDLPICARYDDRLEKMGKILTDFRRYKETVELYYLLAVSIRNREGETVKYGKLLLRIAALQIQIGNHKEGEVLLDHVLLLAGKNGITTESFGKVCDKVGRLYSLAGLEEKALEALKLAYEENLQGKKCMTKEGLQLFSELLWKKGDNTAYFSVKNRREIE
ncbi:MAG: tetratricopeptide repeat protein [Anaerotignum sp.]|nr:tetratricopeptide repeat protein [Anaerotignum sp.]